MLKTNTKGSPKVNQKPWQKLYGRSWLVKCQSLSLYIYNGDFDSKTNIFMKEREKEVIFAQR